MDGTGFKDCLFYLFHSRLEIDFKSCHEYASNTGTIHRDARNTDTTFIDASDMDALYMHPAQMHRTQIQHTGMPKLQETVRKYYKC